MKDLVSKLVKLKWRTRLLCLKYVITISCLQAQRYLKIHWWQNVSRGTVEWLQEDFEQPEEEVIQDGPIDELPGSDVRDTLAAFFMSPEGQNLELE